MGLAFLCHTLAHASGVSELWGGALVSKGCGGGNSELHGSQWGQGSHVSTPGCILKIFVAATDWNY